MLRNIINKLRSLKPAYMLYNFFHQKQLQHNKALYRQFNIKKPLYWNVSSVDFASLPQQKPWLDEPGAKERLLQDADYRQLPCDVQEKLLQWIDQGFMVWENFMPAEEAEAINTEVDSLLDSRKIQPLANGKIMFAFKQSALINNMVRDERLLQLLQFIFGQPVIPFQTINFLKGSQQRAHSDSIHMTTYPLGYLAAAWVALEDIDDQNGSLFYYPGSHQLPYILSPDFDHHDNSLQLDPQTHQHYEEKVAEVIAEASLLKKNFYARKGDLFLWHANLIHGGNRIEDATRTRKSMVVHYFAQNVVKYHEISQRPALIQD
jgi:ectoine hydroxylase